MNETIPPLGELSKKNPTCGKENTKKEINSKIKIQMGRRIRKTVQTENEIFFSVNESKCLIIMSTCIY